jgi:F-type H+-transporting ATPase subunit b
MDTAALFSNPVFWVTISFLMFIALILKVKLPGMIGKALDARAEKISAQLDEARTLKEDAQALLAQFQRKQRDAKKEAEAMTSQAREDAALFAKEAEVNLEALIERQAKAGEAKIEAAEANAVKEVKAAAVEIAIGAARNMLEDKLQGDKADSLVNAAIDDLENHLK